VAVGAIKWTCKAGGEVDAAKLIAPVHGEAGFARVAVIAVKWTCEAGQIFKKQSRLPLAWLAVVDQHMFMLLTFRCSGVMLHLAECAQFLWRRCSPRTDTPTAWAPALMTP
jgi:hypothetical protein